MLIVPLVVRKRIDVGAGGLEMLNPLLNFLCYAFMLLLAFIMINVWTEQVNKLQIFGNEVLFLEESVLAVKFVDAEAVVEYKQHVIEYLDMVEKYELQQILPMGGAPQANEKFEELEAMVDAEYAKIAKRLDAAGVAAVFFAETESFFSAREERVNHAPLGAGCDICRHSTGAGTADGFVRTANAGHFCAVAEVRAVVECGSSSGFDAGPDFVCGLQQFHGAAGRASAGAHGGGDQSPVGVPGGICGAPD